MRKIFAYVLAASLSIASDCSYKIPEQPVINSFVAKKSYTAEEIIAMQQFLNCYVHSRLDINGFYCSSTACEVSRFQADEGIYDKKGLAGVKTLEMMARRCRERGCGDDICDTLGKIAGYQD
jgi:hypothetical protein